MCILLCEPVFLPLTFVIISRQFNESCGDKGSKPDSFTNNVNEQTIVSQNVINKVLSGFTGEINALMRALNGNGRRKLKLCHQNLRGGVLTTNEDKLTSLDTAMKFEQPDVLGISETQLGENTHGICDYEGYVWQTKDDSSRISVLVNDSLTWRRRWDLEIPGISAIWIELGSQTKSPTLVCNCYREWQRLQNEAPAAGEDGSDSEHAQMRRWQLFVEVWKEVVESGQEFHVMGDFNCDRAKWRQLIEEQEEDEGYESETEMSGKKKKRLPPKLQSLIDHLYEEIFNVSETVQLQTKMSFFRQKGGQLKSSVLDLFFTNRPGKISDIHLSGIMDSDHKMIVASRRTADKIPQPSVVKKRSWSKLDWDKFNKAYSESGAEQWILDIEDTDKAATLLDAAVRVHLDMQQQVKIYQLKRRYCPWIDESTKMAIERKKTLHEIWKRTKAKSDHILYKRQNNYVVKAVKQRKKDYYKQRLRFVLGSHDVWKSSRQMVHWPTAGPPTALKINGRLTSSNKEMAQAQNDFFMKKTDDISAKIPETETDPLDFTKKFLQDKDVPAFNFQKVVSEYEVEKVVMNLKNSSATGHDDINTNALKKMLPSILTSLTYVINLSLHHGVFPRIWKLAKVMPLWKNSGDKTEMKFYRPIALLPCFSKVLEKFVSQWLNRHLEVNNLWSDKQHGYRKFRSTSTALVQLQEDIMTKYEEGHDVAVMCYDSSAAFDTICHKILLSKLELYGCSEFVLKWFESYLSDRWQYCEIGGKKSTTTKILRGVFQGSVLGPLLYILYCNCIVVLEDKDTKLTLYADDTTAAQRLYRNELQNRIRMRVKAAQMQRYMDSNHLKFNAEKTNLIIKNKGRNNNHKLLDLEMGDRIIKQEETVKVLGIIVGQDEKYKEYLINGAKSMLKFLHTRLSMLKLLSKFADFRSRKALAEGLCLSKLNYCICLWATTTGEVLDKLQVVQNDVVRTVFGIGRKLFNNLDPLYKKLKWVRVRETIRYHDAITLHSILTHDTPRDLAGKFSQTVYHSHNTRAATKGFRVTNKTRSTNTVRSSGFVCRAAREYASLPNLITETALIPRHAFKDKCRSLLGGWEVKESTQQILWWLEDLKYAETMEK